MSLIKNFLLFFDFFLNLSILHQMTAVYYFLSAFYF